MDLDRKRALDYWVGRPLLAGLDVAANCLGAVMHRAHATEPVRNALFVKFQGIGSLVISKPAIAAFGRAYPEARCIFWGTPALARLAQQMPEFDVILVLDDRTPLTALRSCVTALLRLWRMRIDWAFDLEVYSRLSSVLVTLTCARNRAGFALEQLRARRVHTHLIYFNRYGYIGEAYARMIGQMLPQGHEVDVCDYGNMRFAFSALPSISIPYFVFNVHAGEMALERRWPLESFRVLIDALLERRPDATAVLIGHGESEARYASGLGRTDRVLDLCGKLSLDETVRVLANAELLVTNDSGPLHLALATRTPIVGLFGPTRGVTYLPPGRERAVVVQEPIYCSPCVHHWEPPPCGGDNQCMKRLRPSTVIAACESVLGLPPREATVAAAAPAGNYYAGLVYARATEKRRSRA
jgi:ADP-heptose:LPS heptosyltransferase